MKKIFFCLIFSLLISIGAVAKTLEQKKEEIKKIYHAGGISKIEYEKAIEFLESSDLKEKEAEKKTLFTKKNKDKNKNNPLKLIKKDKDLEKITLKKIEKLGKPVKFDDTYFTKGMIKKFKGCNNSFKCKGDKAGQELFKTFNRSKSYGQQNPGKMIKAMAMYEVFFAKKLWYAKKSIERYKENNYNNVTVILLKQKDEKEIRSLIGINKGRKSMREALGMKMETPTKEVIKKFWLLGEFLDLGKGVKNKKLNKDLKERQKLLETYKNEIVNLKKKLKDDIDKEEDEKSVE